MTLVASMQYLKGLLDGLTWPASMQALPNPPGALLAHVTAPNPNVTASAPNAYIWFLRGMENRDGAKYGAGTIPRAQYPGGPSGTKAIEHTVPIYLVWDGSRPTRWHPVPRHGGRRHGRPAGLPGPGLITDPWTGEQSRLVDVGESMPTTSTYGHWRISAWNVGT